MFWTSHTIRWVIDKIVHFFKFRKFGVFLFESIWLTDLIWMIDDDELKFGKYNNFLI